MATGPLQKRSEDPVLREGEGRTTKEIIVVRTRSWGGLISIAKSGVQDFNNRERPRVLEGKAREGRLRHSCISVGMLIFSVLASGGCVCCLEYSTQCQAHGMWWDECCQCMQGVLCESFLHGVALCPDPSSVLLSDFLPLLSLQG